MKLLPVILSLVFSTIVFSQDQAKIFWPVYREYEHELAKIGDERIAIIKDYAANFENMTDEKAKNLIERSFKFQEKRTKLRKKYFKKMDKVLQRGNSAPKDFRCGIT